MTKISKSAYNAFAENLKVARGFVKMHRYISDLLAGGEVLSSSFQGFLEMANELLTPLGLGHEFLEGILKGAIEEKMAPELERKTQELEKLDEKQFEELSAKFKPKLEEILTTVDEVKVAVERGLLQQALVVTISALEVYLHDITVEAVANNRFIEKRFTKQLSTRFNYNRLLKAEHDLGIAKGEAVAESYKFQEPRSVRRHLNTLLGSETPLDEDTDLKRLRLMLQYRNLVAHRAGVVDEHFKQATGYKGKVGEVVNISRDFADDCLDFAERTVMRVQSALKGLKARTIPDREK